MQETLKNKGFSLENEIGFVKMMRAGTGSRAPAPALPQHHLLGASRVMAAHHPSVEGVEFKDIPGFPRYCVGDDGSVWSSCRGNWMRLKSAPAGDMGYLKVNLCRTGRMFNRYIHQLVLVSFVGDRPDGMEVRHLDGNHLNNRAGNLAWGTSLENKADMIRHGTSPKGERNPLAKLTAAKIAGIRTAAAAGESRKVIGARYGIAPDHVGLIARRKVWKHVP